jgi:hypothetical protein
MPTGRRTSGSTQEHPESAAAWERLSVMIVDVNVATDYVVIAD